jgi:hypothetical protein
MLMYLFCISGEIFWKVFGVHATVRRLFRGEDECSLSEGLCSLSEGLDFRQNGVVLAWRALHNLNSH